MVKGADGQDQITDVVQLDDLPDQNFNNRTGRHEFDTRSGDPSYLLTVPADGTYRILVRDSSSSVRTDPRLVYRLAIRKPAPDYRIVAVPGESPGGLALRRGGRDLVRIFVDRRDGFDGDIRVSVTGLPQGVTSEEIVIGSGNTMGTLVLTAAEDAPVATATLQVTSKATFTGQEVTRRARYGAALTTYQFAQPLSNIASVPARLVDRIQVSVIEAETGPSAALDRRWQADRNCTRWSGQDRLSAEGTRRIGGNLVAFPIDFPPQTGAPQVSIGATAAGEFEMRLTGQTLRGPTRSTWPDSIRGCSTNETRKRPLRPKSVRTGSARF